MLTLGPEGWGCSRFQGFAASAMGKGEGGKAMCDMAVFVLLHRTDELVGYPSTHSINGCHLPLEHDNCHYIHYTLLKHFYINFFLYCNFLICTILLTFIFFHDYYPVLRKSLALLQMHLHCHSGVVNKYIERG